MVGIGISQLHDDVVGKEFITPRFSYMSGFFLEKKNRVFSFRQELYFQQKGIYHSHSEQDMKLPYFIGKFSLGWEITPIDARLSLGVYGGILLQQEFESLSSGHPYIFDKKDFGVSMTYIQDISHTAWNRLQPFLKIDYSLISVYGRNDKYAYASYLTDPFSRWVRNLDLIIGIGYLFNPVQ